MYKAVGRSYVGLRHRRVDAAALYRQRQVVLIVDHVEVQVPTRQRGWRLVNLKNLFYTNFWFSKRYSTTQ